MIPLDTFVAGLAAGFVASMIRLGIKALFTLLTEET